MAYPNYSDTNLNPLILNYVPDKVTFDQMENDDRIEEDQLYLIPEDDEQVVGTFFAEYNVTTWDEVVDAIEAGKNVIAVYNYNNSNYYLPLIHYVTNSPIMFEILHDGIDFWVVLDTDNEWNSGSYPIGGSSSTNLSDTISSSLNASQGTAATPNAVYSALANVTVIGDVTGSMNTASWNIATTIADNAITSNKIATNAINNSHIANFSISSTKLENPSMNIAGSIVALGGSLNAATLVNKLGLSTAMHFIGKATVAITDNSTTNPNISGYDFANDKKAGDVIIDPDSNYEYVWTTSGAWERLGPDSGYKVLQNVVNSPTANGSASAFIDTISQDTQGVITVTKKTVALANNFTVQFNGGTTEGTGKYTFNGSAAKSVNIKSGTGIEIAAAANEITIANAGVLSVKGAAESSYRAGNVSINGANILGSNAIGNNSTPVYWNGSAFVETSNIVDEKVKAVNLNGLNNGQSLLIAASLGASDANTAYVSNNFYWNDYSQTLYIDSRSNNTSLHISPTIVGFHKNATIGGYLGIDNLTAARNYKLPDASGTIALKESPNFTGTPTAPTAAAGTNTTQIATTAFVTTAIAQASRIQTALNPSLTAVNGAWNWSISAMNINNPADIIISVYEKSTGIQVYPDITVNQSSGAISISINDTQSNVALAANTYKAVIIG